MIKLRSISYGYFNSNFNRKFEGISAAALIGSAAVSAAGSIASSGVASNGRRRSQRRAFEYNQRLMQEQNQWNKHMWELENAYNTPSAMKQRLIDAGYNPFLADDAGNSSSPASGASNPSVQPVDDSEPIAQGIQSIGNIPQMMLQYSQMAEQIRSQKLANDRAELAYNFEKDHYYPQQISASDWHDFLNRTNLNIAQSDLHISDNGVPDGYYKDDKLVFFNNYEQSIANQYIGNLVETGSRITTQNDQHVVTMNSIRKMQTDVLNSIDANKREWKLLPHKVKQLKAMASQLFAVARQINYNREQMELTKDSTGKDANTRNIVFMNQINEANALTSKIQSEFAQYHEIMSLFQPVMQAISMLGAGALGFSVGGPAGALAGVTLGSQAFSGHYKVGNFPTSVPTQVPPYQPVNYYSTPTGY